MQDFIRKKYFEKTSQSQTFKHLRAQAKNENNTK